MPLAKMLTLTAAFASLEKAISEGSDDVYLSGRADAAGYLACLEADIKAHLCEPFLVTAQVMSPGFPSAAVGKTLTGYCIANARGYWLVLQPDEARFMCFWGEGTASLGAHGVYGSPLYCWSA